MELGILHFYVPEIDSSMPVEIRFPEGVHSPCWHI